MDHPRMRMHLTFETGNYEVEQLRTGTIIDANVYYTDEFLLENYQNNFPIFQKMLDSLKFR